MLFSACEAIEVILSQVEYKKKGAEEHKDSQEYVISERASYFSLSGMLQLKMHYYNTTLLHIMCSYNFL